MEYVMVFQFGPIHVPSPRGKWPNPHEVEIKDDKYSFYISIGRPQSVSTHEIDDISTPVKKVADCYIPIIARYEIDDFSQPVFKDVTAATVVYATTFVERLRVQSRQAHLKMARTADLEFIKVQDANSIELSEVTKAYQEWFDREHGGRPLPYISKEVWDTVCAQPPSESVEMSQWQKQIPLHESLLLDAELQVETDFRITVMYSALACEVYVQTWLDERARRDAKLRQFMSWAMPRDGQQDTTNVMTFFDLGLRLATGKSLKDNKQLLDAFRELLAARNKLAHLGRLPSKLKIFEANPSKAITIARKVIEWVQSLGKT